MSFFGKGNDSRDRASAEQQRARAIVADSIAVDQFQADVQKGKVPEGWSGTANAWYQQNYGHTKEAEFINSEYTKYESSDPDDAIDEYFSKNYRN